MWRGGCPKDRRAESLLLRWCKGEVDTLWLARWEMVGLLTGRVCVLVVVVLKNIQEVDTFYLGLCKQVQLHLRKITLFLLFFDTKIFKNRKILFIEKNIIRNFYFSLYQ
jgi:hypothetical protein